MTTSSANKAGNIKTDGSEKTEPPVLLYQPVLIVHDFGEGFYAEVIDFRIAEASSAFITPSLFMSPSRSLNSQAITIYSPAVSAPLKSTIPSDFILTLPQNT